MCKLRQRGRGYDGPAGSRGIDPSLQAPCCDGRGLKKAAPALGAGGNAGAVLMDEVAAPPWFQVKSQRLVLSVQLPTLSS
jgi:hypothetical protein